MRIRRHLLAEAPWDAMEKFAQFCDNSRITMLEATVGWMLAIPGMSSVIAGATTPAQVVAILSTGFFATGAALSVAQLFQESREEGKLQGRSWRFLSAFPSAAELEALAYRILVIGFVFWTFTLVAGAIWAQRAWGRYWGWDTKEVWTFIIWTLFAGYIHARATRGWRGRPAAILSLIGFGAVVFNYSIVNIFFKGLHAYSGL
jgi:cytochrome c-type biogenesis protein CcsB